MQPTIQQRLHFGLQTHTALIYDAVNIFMTAYAQLAKNEEMYDYALSCQSSTTSDHGAKISAYLQNVSYTKHKCKTIDILHIWTPRSIMQYFLRVSTHYKAIHCLISPYT